MPGDASDIERKLEAPMPWIGMYVAVASLICALAMAADTIHGFRGKKHWFPSKVFSLNATSLTLLAVAMKLPVDLTTRMYAATDRLAKICSLAFMSTAMANFITSLGSMEDKDILMNVTALAILVLTVVVNFCVQVIQMRQFLRGRLMFCEEITAAAFMLLSLLMVISSAVMAPATKNYLESKYHEMMKMASDEQILESMEEGDFMFDKLRNMIKKYWVMAETSSPQFVIARSVTCTVSGIISMLTAVLVAQAEIRLVMEYKGIDIAASTYGWSTKWIVLAQSFGVAVGAAAPAIRCFNAIRFKCSENVSRGFRDEFKIDGYWTQMMVEWRQSSLPMQIRDRKWRKFFHKTKGLILSFLVRVQILIVLCSIALRYIFFCFATPCFLCLKRLKSVFSSSKSQVHGISGSQEEILDLSRYVLLLEGEAELPQNIQVNICEEVERLVRTGKKQQPKNLLSLLHKVGNFKGLREVDKNQVPSLHSQEPPKCWSLPLVTLTSIAIALPNIPKKEVSWLLQSVDEGLFYVKLIEKTLDKKGNLVNSRNAADVIWVGVELYRKWQDNDLQETSLKGRDSKETLQELSKQAEQGVVDFKREMRDFVMENPLNWPVKAIAANSMYRICQRLLKAYEGDHLQADERLFQQLVNMIANILAASLTNLMRVVIIKCHQRDIKKKEKNVREAALLLGETEEILQVLQQHRRATTRTDPDELEFIEKWCNLLIKRKV
ncbi:uncharacterized protein LOC125210309 [Salvia hispanica]|uniref:uncharacterized protein LOC125210309 n=1 Tax=Salvia hispanica TaxID=49212 RepID=UPI002009BCB4|nr:uncharacterized protein LOC125210309 [Salvia hispanica]